MEFALLGGLAVKDGGRPVDLGGPKQRAVLAALLLEAGHAVPADRLVELVWGDEAPARADSSLQAYVSNLRRLLEPDRRPRAEPAVLVRRGSGYALVVPRDAVDVWRLEDEVAAGHRALSEGDPASAATLLDRTLARWTAPLLPELDDRPWVVQAAARLAAVRAGAVEDRADAGLALGRPAEVVDLLERAITTDPYRERLRGQLALALHRSGRRRDALVALDDARRALGEVGLEPGRELRDLEQAILAEDPGLDGPAPPGPVAAVRRPAPTAPAPVGGPVGPEEAGSRPFVGRERDLAVLGEALAAAARGAGRPVVVSGEPGIGKTRLVEELTRHARGTVVAWARCPESTAQAAYWPCVQLGRRLAAAGVATAELGALLPEADLPGVGEPVADRMALHAMAADALVTSEVPSVLVVDDLQWADPASLRLFEYLAGELQRSRTLLVVTVRPVGADAPVPLLDCLAELARQPGAVRIDLAGLSSPDVGRLLELRTHGHVDPRVVELVHDRTGGNAFFVGEVVELLSSEGDADDLRGALRGGAVPAAVHDVVRRRIGQLPPATQQLLSTASVIGRTFDLDVLARVAELDAGPLLDRLEPALDAGLVTEHERPGRFQFSHALVADALTAELSAVRRARAHATVLDALEELRAGELDEDVAALAHHAFEGIAAGTAEDAHRWSVRAATLAGDRLAHEDAAEHWIRAARAAGVAWPRDLRLRYDALLEAGRALIQVDAVGPAYEVLSEAIDLGLAAGDAEMALDAGAAMHIDGLWLAGEIAQVNVQAFGALSRAVAASPDPTPTRALALSALADVAYGQVPPAELDRLSAEALAVARLTGDREVIARALHRRNQTMWTAAGLEARREAAGELLEMVSDGRWDPGIESVALFGAATIDWELGRLDRSWEQVERAAGLAVRTRSPALVTQLGWFRAAHLITLGEEVRAQEAVDETYELYRRTRRWTADAFRAVFKGLAWLEMDRLDELLLLEGDILSSQYAPAFTEALAFAHLELGDADGAAALVAGGLPPLVDSWMLTGIAAAAAHTRAALGDVAACRTLVPVLLPYSGRMAVPGSGPAFGDVDLALARAELALGERDAARAHLDRSVDLLTRANARPWLARALLERHALAGDPDDLARAAEVVAGTDLHLLQRRVRERQAGSK